MGREDIFNKVKQTFVDFFDNEELQLSMDTTADDLEDWDSVAHIQLIFDLEGAFGIQFEAETIVGLDSIEKIVDEIEKAI